MQLHVRNEWPIFRGERYLSIDVNFRFFVPLSVQCVPALSAGRLVGAFPLCFLCRFLIFYGGPSL